MADDQRACAECGTVEWVEDMHDDGENDPTCWDCHTAWLNREMRAALRGYSAHYAAQMRWYAEQGLDAEMSEHDERL